jgi:hypothetical protein
MRFINTLLGFTVSILAYKDEIAVSVALLTGIYMMFQITLAAKKLIHRRRNGE